MPSNNNRRSSNTSVLISHAVGDYLATAAAAAAKRRQPAKRSQSIKAGNSALFFDLTQLTHLSLPLWPRLCYQQPWS